MENIIFAIPVIFFYLCINFPFKGVLILVAYLY